MAHVGVRLKRVAQEGQEAQGCTRHANSEIHMIAQMTFTLTLKVTIRHLDSDMNVRLTGRRGQVGPGISEIRTLACQLLRHGS